MIWIYLFLVTLFIRPQDWPGSPLFGWQLNFLVVVGGLFSAVVTGYPRQRAGLRAPQNVLVGVFLAVIFLSNAVHGDAASGAEQFVAFGKRALVYVMFLLYIDTAERLRKTLLAALLLTVVLSLQGMYQTAHDGVGWAQQVIHSVAEGGGAVPQMEAPRTFWIGLWDGPNVLCLAYLSTAAFAFASAISTRYGLPYRLLNLAGFLLLGYGIYQTNSRGGFLALGFMLCACLFVRLGAKRGVLAALAVLPLLVAAQPSRMSSLNSNEESAHERTWLWEQGLTMFRENKLLGIGVGGFAQQAGLVAHNNYVSFLTESGIAGLFVYMALMTLSFKSVLLVYRRAKKDGPELAFLAPVIGVTLAGFCFATFFVLMVHDILFVLWALAACLFFIARQRYRDLALRWERSDWYATAAGTLGVILAAWKMANN